MWEVYFFWRTVFVRSLKFVMIVDYVFAYNYICMTVTIQKYETRLEGKNKIKYSFFRSLLMDVTVLADGQEYNFISSIRTLDVIRKTCKECLPIGPDQERDSGNFVLSVCLDLYQEKMEKEVSSALNGWLVSLFNGISTLFRLFTAKSRLLEEQ